MPSTNNTSAAKGADILELNILMKQFDIMMGKYSDVKMKHQQFVDDFNASNKSKDRINDELISKFSYKFVSPSILAIHDVMNLSKCKAVCSSDKLCSGATYATRTGACTMRTGAGEFVPSVSSDIGILSKNIYYLNMLESLNDGLRKLNSKIMRSSSSLMPEYGVNIANSNKSYNKLSGVHKRLSGERDILRNNIKMITDVDREFDQSERDVASASKMYFLLLAVVIVGGVVTYKSFGRGESRPSVLT